MHARGESSSAARSASRTGEGFKSAALVQLRFANDRSKMKIVL
jgi:hypothetical protein